MLCCVQGFLTGKNYSYSIVGQEDVERANYLLYDTFHPDEPITKHLGLTKVSITSIKKGHLICFFQGGKGIPDADRMIQETVPTHLSMSVLKYFSVFCLSCFSMYLLGPCLPFVTLLSSFIHVSFWQTGQARFRH
jgi:hypothetical protein